MSVSYEIVTRDGQKHVQASAICFGRMNKTDSWSFGNIDAYRPADHVHLNFMPTNHVHQTWSYEDRPIERSWRPGITREAAATNYLNEMKLLVEDMPILKPFVSVHPIIGRIRFTFGDLPADRITTAMFMLRNLNCYPDYIYCYRTMRSMGYRPSFALMVSSMFRMDIDAFGQGTFVRDTMNEAAWLQTRWVQRAGWTNILTGNVEAINFEQLPWTVQKGYRRDASLSRRGVINGTPPSMADCYSVRDQVTGYVPHYHNRDTGHVSVAQDDQLIPESFDRGVRYSMANFQPCLQLIEDFFNSININPRN